MKKKEGRKPEKLKRTRICMKLDNTTEMCAEFKLRDGSADFQKNKRKKSF